MLNLCAAFHRLPCLGNWPNSLMNFISVWVRDREKNRRNIEKVEKRERNNLVTEKYSESVNIRNERKSCYPDTTHVAFLSVLTWFKTNTDMGHGFPTPATTLLLAFIFALYHRWVVAVNHAYLVIFTFTLYVEMNSCTCYL